MKVTFVCTSERTHKQTIVISAVGFADEDLQSLIVAASKPRVDGFKFETIRAKNPFDPRNAVHICFVVATSVGKVAASIAIKQVVDSVRRWHKGRKLTRGQTIRIYGPDGSVVLEVPASKRQTPVRNGHHK